ncbi:Nin one binding Zn-ribbon like-domain-containing protein [Syncephalis pseudoplumigaleata]|uniref:20S-pre-rRNA D-site endonuclease NOB1 n=1 Tax=Syncephalis pseudoplumigaleata TaxID=1712513 RepID=A0A4P9YYM7_9FUNG|nr:Nin one binding Zn-ribbon like-domain-containing protein [Syncephalis pseudoplumigaleata]|eukprot:RKP25216.1 Nin one binding Zn-ribbon like-domain-containing protein [Syncephalis pseudoplumigaleata]
MSTPSAVPRSAEYLVVDTGPLLAGQQWHRLATKLYTIPEVIAEVRDKKSRAVLDSVDLTVRVPTEEAMHAIIRFAKLTGDFAVLSMTDIKVMALAYTLEKERNGVDHLKTAPTMRTAMASTQKPIVMATTPEPSNAAAATVSDESTDEPLVPGTVDTATEDEADEGDTDSDGEWITPDNVDKHKCRDQGHDTDSNRVAQQVDVACMTADFAMQNVLIQMGLHLMSMDGMVIRRVKTWVLRCHACYKITTDMEKQFCPSCGNNTLLRVTAGLNSDGELCIYLKDKFQYNTRGTRYSIPKPQGGKHNNDLVLCEDERIYQVAVHRNRRKAAQQDFFDPDYIPAMLQGNSGRSSQNAMMPTIGHGRRNPNASRRGGKGKRR